ncbi:MAG: GAF domain-containing protein [Candidatus Hydrogenedentes bacterium]|nr:GAF domain-containing protein [Candidatus Hydrogenedentota bacterium]
MNVLLVIAEDRGVWEALRASLPEGDLVLHELDVATARRRIASVNVDAIFLDDTSLSGENLVEAVKDMAPGIPLAVLSNREDLLTQAALTRSGANAVLTKPFSCESLQEALASLLHTTYIAAGASQPVDVPALPGASLGQHQMALRWISRLTNCKADLERLAHRLMEGAVDIFDATRCCLLLEREGQVAVAASHGLSDHITGQLRLSFSQGLMHWFDSHACLFDIMAIRSAPEAIKELQVLNGILAAPLMRDGQVFGALVLGDKASGLSYVQEERELLSLFVRSVEILFEDVYGRNRPGYQGPAQLMASDLPVGMVEISPERKVVAMNRRAEALLQLPATKVVGSSVQRLGSAFADVVLRSIARNEPRYHEVIRDPVTNGQLSINVAPGDAGGAMVAFLPQTEERVSQEEIAYSPFWEYLATRVAQEIKNPMVAINTFAQLLPRKYDSEDFRDAFSRVVQQEVERINRVVETLFEFARNPSLRLQQCDVNDTVRSVLASFESELARHAIKLDQSYDPEVLQTELDPVFIKQAVHNVVQNSIEAMPAGGTIQVRTARRDKSIEIRISDSGPGVSKEDSDLIFLPFYSTKEQGMGLGLTIANRILHQHQGAIRWVTDEKEGNYFALQIPTTELSHANDPGH